MYAFLILIFHNFRELKNKKIFLNVLIALASQTVSCSQRNRAFRIYKRHKNLFYNSTRWRWKVYWVSATPLDILNNVSLIGKDITLRRRRLSLLGKHFHDSQCTMRFLQRRRIPICTVYKFFFLQFHILRQFYVLCKRKSTN